MHFLLILTQVDFFQIYFLESRKLLNYYFLQSRILGKYLYFLHGIKVIQFCRPLACNKGPTSIRDPACIRTSALQQTDGRQHVSLDNRVFCSIDNTQTFTKQIHQLSYVVQFSGRTSQWQLLTMGHCTNLCTFTFTSKPTSEPRLVFEDRLLLVQSMRPTACIRGPVCIQGLACIQGFTVPSYKDNEKKLKQKTVEHSNVYN